MPLIPLEAIREADRRIAPYIRRTPFLRFDHLTHLAKRETWLKCEMFQRTGSFKSRGAANCILQNLAQGKRAGVIAASAGNHAQGVAMVAHLLGIKATIVMPTPTPAIKVQNTQRWGAEIQLVGAVLDESLEHAKTLAAEKGYLFVHAFCDPQVIAGQGTVGLEMLADEGFEDVDAVVIPIGGGGLATGISSVIRALHPEIKIYGVTPKNAPALFKSFRAGKITPEPVKFTLADGTATKRPDEGMLTFLNEALDDIFSLSEESIAHAISILAEHGKMVLEGSGALAAAAVLEGLIPGKKLALVLSGGNVDLPALSLVLHRGMVEQGRMVRLVITITDRPGGLHAAAGVLAEKGANILQVFHQRATLHAMGEAEIEVDLETRGPEHTDEIIRTLKERGFATRRG